MIEIAKQHIRQCTTVTYHFTWTKWTHWLPVLLSLCLHDAVVHFSPLFVKDLYLCIALQKCNKVWFIKYLRYNARADWLATMFISEDRDVARLCLLWYTLSGRCRALEEKEKHSATPKLAFLLLNIFQSVYITVQGHARARFILLKYIYIFYID